MTAKSTPRPKVHLRRKRDGATSFKRVVTPDNALAAVAELQAAHSVAPVHRTLADVWRLTRQILAKQDEATGLYRALVREAAECVAQGHTTDGVRDAIIEAGWTASRASEVLKVAGLPPLERREYLDDGMSWRLTLATFTRPTLPTAMGPCPG